MIPMPVSLDADLYVLCSVYFLQQYLHPAAIGREFHRIAQEIEQYLLEFPFIASITIRMIGFDL